MGVIINNNPRIKMDMIFFLEGDVLFLCMNKLLPQC